MKPFHEIENIPYEEFLNIIQKYTGLTSWRAKISRAGFGVIPSREHPKMLTLAHLRIGQEGWRKSVVSPTPEIGQVIDILNHLSEEDDSSLIKGGWEKSQEIENRLGWSVRWSKEEGLRMVDREDGWADARGGFIDELSIQYIFRRGLKDSMGPEDEDNYYELGPEEGLAWVFDIARIKWSKNDHLEAFDYKSGLQLIPKTTKYGKGFYEIHSDSPEILKKILGHGSLFEFLNWNEGNPLEVKE